mgnify:CR=1 FL=1
MYVVCVQNRVYCFCVVDIVFWGFWWRFKGILFVDMFLYWELNRKACGDPEKGLFLICGDQIGSFCGNMAGF